MFQVGLEKMATEHTRLIYMTTGVLLQKLVQAKCLTEYSHIFVDEVHKHEADCFNVHYFCVNCNDKTAVPSCSPLIKVYYFI